VLESGAWLIVLIGGAVLTGALFFSVAINVGIRPFWGQEAVTPRAPREGAWPLWGAPMVLAGLGVFVGLAPFFAAPLVAAAAGAITGAPRPFEPRLWHGWTPAVGLSGLVLATGLLLFAARSAYVRATAPIVRRLELAPDRAYDAVLAILNRVAGAQTRLLQSGYLRRYLLTVLATMAVFVSYPMLRLLPIPYSWDGARLHEVVVAVLIVGGAGIAVGTSSALTAVAGLGIAGYGLALIYFLFGAPDLALTQFVVETLTVILFVLVLYHLPPFRSFSPGAARARDVAVSAAVGIVIAGVAAISMSVELDPSAAEYYAETAPAVAHGRNIVNVILVDFRALDTLGEITVLGAAAVGAWALLRTRAGGAQP